MEAALRPDRRPTAVVWFEALNVFPVLAAMLLWREGGFFDALVEFLVWVGLTLWVTRGRSRIARAIYTGAMLFAVAVLAAGIVWGYLPPEGQRHLFIVGLVVFAVELMVLLSLLWWPSTTAWLKSRGDGSDRPS